ARQSVPPPPPRSLREERLAVVRPSVAAIVATVVTIEAAPVPVSDARGVPAQNVAAPPADEVTTQGLMVVLLVGLVIAGVGALRLLVPPGREPTGHDVVSWLGGAAARLKRRTGG
ncbi:MAG: hypothetical protein H0V51_25005, partial [Chloroflexi bacterium]|nr:hypothetical protein [Chloroflexota bacterium]